MEKSAVSVVPTESSPIRAGSGIVLFAASNGVVLVPEPSADPQDPLNLPRWRKAVAVVLLSMFSSIALSLLSGLGALLPFYTPEYTRAGATPADISALMTYPLLFMGTANLICVPLAAAIGRRPVYLASVLTSLCSAVICGFARNIHWHLGGRMMLGFAAGNTEALVPLMIQDIHYVHEKSTYLMLQSTILNIVSTIFMLFASPIAAAHGPKLWYLLGAGLSGPVLLLSIMFVPETAFDRVVVSHGTCTDPVIHENDHNIESTAERGQQTSVHLAYRPRTMLSDLRVFTRPLKFNEAIRVVKNTFQVLLFPDVFWAFVLNGLGIGFSVGVQSTYSTILTGTGYEWPIKYTSYVTIGNIISSLVALPILGYGSDFLIQWAARRNRGIHKPERRLILLVLPLCVGITSAIVYGQASSHPGSFYWFAIVWSFGGSAFCFAGFGLVAGLHGFIGRVGYDGVFGTYAGLLLAVGLLMIPIYVFGSRVQRWNKKRLADGNPLELG